MTNDEIRILPAGPEDFLAMAALDRTQPSTGLTDRLYARGLHLPASPPIFFLYG